MSSQHAHQRKKVPEIRRVTFSIWKNGNSSEQEISPRDEGNGIYSIQASFKEEGLYFVKVDASTSESKVIPTKQFIVGSLTEEDMNSLPSRSEGQYHEGHH